MNGSEARAWGDIPIDQAIPIRLQLSGDMASAALQYAALGAGMLVLMGTILPLAGHVDDGSLIWLIEGVLVMGSLHALLNSAYYGRMAGLIGNMMPSLLREDPKDKDFPTNEKDYLSRLAFRYMKETKQTWLIAPFSNVFAWRLIVFVLVGISIGLVLGGPQAIFTDLVAILRAIASTSY